METGTFEGWAYPLNCKKVHYIANGRSLCGRWDSWGSYPADNQRMGEDPGPDDCKTCFRKATKRLAKPTQAPGEGGRYRITSKEMINMTEREAFTKAKGQAKDLGALLEGRLKGGSVTYKDVAEAFVELTHTLCKFGSDDVGKAFRDTLNTAANEKEERDGPP